MFQFEEDNKEYLYFGNFQKRQYEILIYDLESKNLYKRIPLLKEGPNGAMPLPMAKRKPHHQPSASIKRPITKPMATQKIVIRPTTMAAELIVLIFISCSVKKVVPLPP